MATKNEQPINMPAVGSPTKAKTEKPVKSPKIQSPKQTEASRTKSKADQPSKSPKILSPKQIVGSPTNEKKEEPAKSPKIQSPKQTETSATKTKKEQLAKSPKISSPKQIVGSPTDEKKEEPAKSPKVQSPKQTETSATKTKKEQLAKSPKISSPKQIVGSPTDEKKEEPAKSPKLQSPKQTETSTTKIKKEQLAKSPKLLSPKPMVGSPTNEKKEEPSKSPTIQNSTRADEAPSQASSRKASTSSIAENQLLAPANEIIREPKGAQFSKLTPTQVIGQGREPIQKSLSAVLSPPTFQSLQSPPKQASEDSRKQKPAQSSSKQLSVDSNKEESVESTRRAPADSNKEETVQQPAKEALVDSKKKTSLQSASKKPSETGSKVNAPSSSKKAVNKDLGTKQAVKPTTSSSKAKASKTRSTQVDFDYDPYYWRYNDSWNPAYDWGYYGEYGEWRPEEEWPYYAPYGMAPVSNYHPYPPEPPYPVDHLHEPPFPSPTCPVHGRWRHHPAPQSSQGTIVSIPIPISVPMPIPSGSSGPVVINPPPPPPPPPPPAAPPPAQQRSSPLQDMVSLMTAMMLKDAFKGSISSEDMAAALRALAPSEVQPQPSAAPERDPVVAFRDRRLSCLPTVTADNLRTLLLQQAPAPVPQYVAGEPGNAAYVDEVPNPVASTNVGKKKKKKAKSDEEPQDVSDLSDEAPGKGGAKGVQPTAAVPLAAVSKKGADEVHALGTSSLDTNSDNDEHSHLNDETTEEDEEGEPETAFEAGSRRFLRICCALWLVLFLACILVGNVAYLVAPESFSDFLCGLGIYAKDNISMADENNGARNRSVIELPVEDEAFGRSIFDIQHPDSDDLLFNDLDAEIIDESDQEPETLAGCNSSSLCSRSTQSTSAYNISTESAWQRFINSGEGDAPPEIREEDDEAFNTLGFDSFLDFAALTRRSIAMTASTQGLHKLGHNKREESETNPSVLRDLLSRFPQPSRGRFLMTPPQTAYILDGNLTQLGATAIYQPVVTLEEFLVPPVPATNKRSSLLHDAFRYLGKTDPPVIFHLNRILPKRRFAFEAHHSM